MKIGRKSMSWMEELRKDIASIHSSKKDLIKFGLLVGSVLLLISGIASWKHWWPLYFIEFIGISGVILITLGILRPLRLKLIHRYWMGLAFIIGSIVSTIILFIMFYFILTPLAGAARVFGKRFFLTYKENKRSSYWNDRENPNNINYERMN
jgi:hypothetical protein